MDPRYMDNCELNTLSIALLQRRSCEIKVVPHLLGLVSLLGVEEELGWGEMTVW